ncbi:MAG: hypothetical protein JNL08_05840 [Planctomycetes bacterium]|nr:hypothetical protein [Planctomycetota bacterium]
MQTVLPVRRPAINAPAILAAPATSLIEHRGATGAEFALRGEHRGNLAGAFRRAAVADRFGQPTTAVVLDAGCVLHFLGAAAASATATTGGSR